mgnify:CR=1 FL=1
MANRSSAAETLSQTNSESSTSLSSSMEVTVEKYQRLATEYAKVFNFNYKTKKSNKNKYHFQSINRFVLNFWCSKKL